MDRLFDKNSFDNLSSTAEVESAVKYLGNNEITFRSQLVREGLDCQQVAETVRDVWTGLLKQCARYNYSNYLTETKRKLYKG